MDSRFLETFLLVAELGSIAEAARRLDLTPATVAQRLSALEATIGSKLVLRSGRTVRPTVAGLRVLPRAHAVLRELRDLKSAASETALPAGPLRLGATPTALTGIVPGVLKRWVEAYPQIEIYIEPGATTALHSRVMDGELDAAILVQPQFELPKTAAWHTLRREPLVLLTPSSLRVTDVLQTLAREPFIRYDRHVIGGRMADEYLSRKGIHPQVRFELDGIENIARLVAEGLGVSVLPDWPVVGLPSQAVAKWPLPRPRPVRTVGVLWLQATVRAPLVKAFVRLAGPAPRAPA
ncbi:LysR family transcriptional regulator [Variovorax terrae]|uniref:LysR family transcriptional regulator n=1 Tax=Variovorax terrae TaxID=2923278 RepID=A0A9X1VVX2_9BURK|nr:LysR family transcriptional regulator [Variovorax terrae]MCJ0761648.1 LysR family transcriptional regulator [Variovorax terrae]